MREVIVAIIDKNGIIVNDACKYEVAAEVLGVSKPSISNYVVGRTTSEDGFQLIKLGYDDDYFTLDELKKWKKQWDKARKAIKNARQSAAGRSNKLV